MTRSSGGDIAATRYGLAFSSGVDRARMLATWLVALAALTTLGRREER